MARVLVVPWSIARTRITAVLEVQRRRAARR
jgi:hypothetical protein